MTIIISNSSGIPIYEQIKEQIKALICSGALCEGDALPSMRVLAKELRISLITTKRAYEELEREGYITSFTGRGSFVLKTDHELIRSGQLEKIEQNFAAAVKAARLCNIQLDELCGILKHLYNEGGEKNNE